MPKAKLKLVPPKKPQPIRVKCVYAKPSREADEAFLKGLRVLLKAVGY